MIHKYEYIDNLKVIAWHHNFDNSFEYKNGFSIDLANRFKSPVAGEKKYPSGYYLKLKKGNMYWNIAESEGYKHIDEKFSKYAKLSYCNDLKYMINDLFEMRVKYPSFELLGNYYFAADSQDIEIFLLHFDNVFDAVVEKCCSQYRSSVMQGATELAFALSHKWHSTC